MKYKFPINTCPLCGSEITELTCGQNSRVWECIGTKIGLDGLGYVPHYQVETNLDTNVVTQHVVIYPFLLNTFSNNDKTMVHIIKKGTIIEVMTVPQIHMDTYDNLLQRIKKLVIFS